MQPNPVKFERFIIVLFVKVPVSFFNFIILLLICKTKIFMVIFKTVFVQSFIFFLYYWPFFIACAVISVLRTNMTVLRSFVARISLPKAKNCEKKLY